LGRCVDTCQAVLSSITVICILFTASTFAAEVQQADRAYRLGFLGQTSAQDLARQVSALRKSLRDFGYEEGRNLDIEYRWAERKLESLPALATELVAQRVDVIVTHGSAGARAAKQATSTIPIVIAVVGDPVASGVVASVDRPGGNVTGLVLEEFETTVKWFELLRQIVPGVSSVGMFEVPGVERPEVENAVRRKEDGAARAVGLNVFRVTVRNPQDLRRAFDEFRRQAVSAVVVPNTSLLNPLSGQIASLAVEHQLPTIGSPLFARAGGLLAYGPDGADMYRRAAGYVDRILKGASPADLPMQGPTKFEFIVNMRTARALTLSVPREILARADQIID